MNRAVSSLKMAGIEFKTMEPMKNHTSFKIGGEADLFVLPKNFSELEKTVKLAEENHLPLTVVGNGSNLLVSDMGIEGVVICLEKMNNVTVSGEVVTAGAGALLGRIASHAAENSLTGMEFAAGIPGSVGGAVVMNAGAYGGEMKDIVTLVRAYHNGKLVEIDISGCYFAYRHSIFSSGDYIITEVVIKLKKGDKSQIYDTMKELATRRREKQPLEYPSAGSTFKRPEGYFAGALIEGAGLKGCSVGDAQVSEKHAGFVINKGNATCDQVMELILHIKNEVFKNSGVMLEEEVKVTGRK